ncbi:MAG: GAF domain-containing protein [Telluria sp.]
MRSIPKPVVALPHDGSADAVLTTSAAAELLGVAVSTAQQWIEGGAIPSWKTPGGHRRVRAGDVMRLVGQRARSSAHNETAQGPLETEYLPLEKPDFPVPRTEADRLRALRGVALVDTAADAAFDRLTSLAAHATECPMALVTLLTSERQWFKSRIGIEVAETPRSWAFCSHTILNGGLTMVEDATTDPRFRFNPLVTGALRIRFYGGFPVLDSQGHRLGALCVLDREPRRLRGREIHSLRTLAELVSEEIQRQAVAPQS